MNKPFERRKARNYMDRPIFRLNTRKRFLIVCEGRKTEPYYFRDFPVPKDIINIVGCGFNTKRLVEEAISLRRNGEYDQTWCVFDGDDFPEENIIEAFALAKRNNIRIAFSNESFELWYILHFNYLSSAITRRDYCLRLSVDFQFEYEKNKEHIYRILLPRQKTALIHAKRLITEYEEYDPIRNNPSTTVYLLVEELNKQIGKYLD